MLLVCVCVFLRVCFRRVLLLMRFGVLVALVVFVCFDFSLLLIVGSCCFAGLLLLRFGMCFAIEFRRVFRFVVSVCFWLLPCVCFRLLRFC